MRLHHQFPLLLSCRDILRWMHPRIHYLFLHLPVTFVLAFSGLGVLTMQDILILVYYTITNDSFHLNFIITNDSFLNFFFLNSQFESAKCFFLGTWQYITQCVSVKIDLVSTLTTGERFYVYVCVYVSIIFKLGKRKSGKSHRNC